MVRGGAIALVASVAFAPGPTTGQDARPTSIPPPPVPATRAPPSGSDSLPFELLWEVRHASDPRISPDGSRVAYLRHAFDRDLDRAVSRIELVRSDGGEGGDVERLTEDWQQVLTPSFSPRGGEVAYPMLVEGFWEIRLFSPATRTTRTLLVTPYQPAGMAWSPEGTRIAFTQETPDAPGARILFLEVAGGRPREATPSDFGRVSLGERIEWIPGGRALVVAARDSGEVGAGGGGGAAFEITLANGGVRRLTDRELRVERPAVSVDGMQLAFVAARGANAPRQLFVQPLDGVSSARPLTGPGDSEPEHPVWAPDGSGVYAVLTRGGASRLALFRLDGSMRTIVDGVRTDGVGAPYSVAGLAPSRRVAVAITRPDVPGEIVTADPGRSPRAVTSLGWHLEDRWRAALPVGLPGGGHGWTLEAASVDGGRASPADSPLILVHPRALGLAGPAGFSFEGQALAAAGISVLVGLGPGGGPPTWPEPVPPDGPAASGLRVRVVPPTEDDAAAGTEADLRIAGPGASGGAAPRPSERIEWLRATVETIRRLRAGEPE